MALATSGCLITDFPEFHQPDRNRPVLSNISPSPAKIGVIPLRKGTPPFEKGTIKFEVASEDRQRPLHWFLVLDFKGFNNGPFRVNGEPVAGGDIPVSELIKQTASRTAEFTIPPDTNVGCHSLTVVVSHDFKTFSPDPVVQQDVDFVTWWYQVGVDLSVPDPVYDRCIPDPIPLDAGVDGRDGMSP